MQLVSETHLSRSSTHLHYIYLKQILNHVYIDSYRNRLSQINHFLELLLYNLHADEPDHNLIWNYTNDMLDEIRVNNSDLSIAGDSVHWLQKTIKQKNYSVLNQLIEDILIDNNHFTQVSTLDRYTLIIDPKLTVLKFLNIALRQNGIQTLRFQKTIQALKYINNIEPNISTIICEYNLPELNAGEFLNQLKSSNYSEIPVLFIANYQDTAEIREKFGIGTVDFLSKPIQAEIVVSKIKALSR